MDGLRQLAARRARENGAEVVEAFEARLARIDDSVALKKLALEFYADGEVSIPVYRRALELMPHDLETLVQLGFVHFLCGEDDEAALLAVRARALDPGHPEMLKLEASLTKDRGVKLAAYENVLKIDPEDEVAKGQLERLHSGQKYDLDESSMEQAKAEGGIDSDPGK